MFLVVVILINRISTAISNIKEDNFSLMYTLLKEDPVRKSNSYWIVSEEKLNLDKLFKTWVIVFENKLNVARII